MLATTDPNLIVGGYALGGIVLYLFWRLTVWVRDSPTHPDPWEADVALKLADPEITGNLSPLFHSAAAHRLVL